MCKFNFIGVQYIQLGELCKCAEMCAAKRLSEALSKKKVVDRMVMCVCETGKE